jgi:hypothetical protein
MDEKRWWVPVAFIAPCVVLAWLSVKGPLPGWITYAAWAVVAVSVVARAVGPRARGHRVREAVGPVFGSVSEVQDIYLGRPDVGPVVYGSDGQPGTELVIDRTDPDPGDLAGRPSADRTAADEERAE